ncbi:hypothetical protein BDV34DRAFT_225113 [Aspergillus parasiticus]|uniref:AhpD-like protein n=1 Tax=Aspergillus parasiticus TaxID=5067 RepID=A0A5N6DMI4_ASPPA|nr:hypothetical protein BDV34DRAFT_225113 [Aspergillus parasiticus]
MDTELTRFLHQHGPVFAEKLGHDRWYLIALAALTSGDRFATAGGVLYRYLSALPEYATRAKRQFLIRRLRETLMKLVFVVGIPKSLEGMISLAKEIDELDIDSTFTRSDWSPEKTKARGEALNDRIYQGDADPVFELLKHHQDFIFVIKEIGYGLFLSDETVLPIVEGETILLASLVVQETPVEIASHTKGLARLGLDENVVDEIKTLSGLMVTFMRSSNPSRPLEVRS